MVIMTYQVTASSWLNDLRDQLEHTRILNVVYRSATAVGSHLPSIASAKARVAGAGALLRPVSSSTQVMSCSIHCNLYMPRIPCNFVRLCKFHVAEFGDSLVYFSYLDSEFCITSFL